MTKSILLTGYYIGMAILIMAILPTACDREYEIEHPTDVTSDSDSGVYISPADRLVIDWSRDDG